MPKFKFFVFLSVIQIFFNLASFLNTSINNNTFDLLTLFSGIGISFVPFVSLIQLVFSNMDVFALAFIGIFTGMISAFQTYLIAEIVLSHLPTVNV